MTGVLVSLPSRCSKWLSTALVRPGRNGQPSDHRSKCDSQFVFHVTLCSKNSRRWLKAWGAWVGLGEGEGGGGGGGGGTISMNRENKN